MKPEYDPVALADEILGMPVDTEQLVAASQPYLDLLGFVPSRVRDRLTISGALDPRSVKLQEQLRDHAMASGAFDPKLTQILIFTILLMDLNDAALTHAIAARRCGASWKELQAAVTLCSLFRGLPAANRGASVLAEAMHHEQAAGER